MTDSILANLTPEQRAAVTHFTGPMLVVAGAGSGKTRVVTARMAWLLTQGVAAGQILALTFTNKAAGEMRERVQKISGNAPQAVGTFHSLCARWLRYDIGHLNDGRERNFSIYADDDQQALLKQIVRDFHLDPENFKARAIAEKISFAKCQIILPADYVTSSWREAKIAEIYHEYEKRLRQNNAVDFDDLLLLVAQLLEKFPALRAAYQRRYPFILVDEYQDTNRLQYRLLRWLCSPENNLHATGDPDQSIYSWRGADYRNIMDFQHDFPQAKIVRLERNYRSTGNILHAANTVIKNNPYRLEKNLYTDGEVGEKIVVQSFSSAPQESAWIAAQIHRLQNEGVPNCAIAIFYRVNALSRSVEEALIRHNIPYQIIGGVRFYERKEIRDALAFLRLRVNPFDQQALTRVLNARPVGVGDKTLAQILTLAQKLQIAPLNLLARADFTHIFSEYGGRSNAKLKNFAQWCAQLAAIATDNAATATEQILALSGMEAYLLTQVDKDPSTQDRLENLTALLTRAREFSAEHNGDLARFLEDVSLVADIDRYETDVPCVSLMTLHSAKGLEFAAVFLIGLEEGTLPHSRSLGETGDSLAEERRLFYVGITRAQQHLFITATRMRELYGSPALTNVSRFLSELPPAVLATTVEREDVSFDDDFAAVDFFTDDEW